MSATYRENGRARIDDATSMAYPVTVARQVGEKEGILAKMICLLAGLCVLSMPVQAENPGNQEEFVGTVRKVVDGDTLVIEHRSGSKRIVSTICVWGVDCPEIQQRFGPEARKFTTSMVLRKQVQVFPMRRTSGVVTGIVYYDLGKRNSMLSDELMARGLAWANGNPPDPTLVGLEAKARKRRLGLWRDRKPMPPWEWRAARKRKGSP